MNIQTDVALIWHDCPDSRTNWQLRPAESEREKNLRRGRWRGWDGNIHKSEGKKWKGSSVMAWQSEWAFHWPWRVDFGRYTREGLWTKDLQPTLMLQLVVITALFTTDPPTQNKKWWKKKNVLCFQVSKKMEGDTKQFQKKRHLTDHLLLLSIEQSSEALAVCSLLGNSFSLGYL
jgi:hypothetical protein